MVVMAALGIAIVIVVCSMIRGGVLFIDARTNTAVGIIIFFDKTKDATVLLKITFRENKIIPEEKSATPPVAFPSSIKEDFKVSGKGIERLTQIRARIGAITIGSVKACLI